MSRRLMLRNVSGGGGILPPEYQQVEWIGHATNTLNYINSVSKYDNVNQIVMDLEFTAKAKYGVAIVIAKTGRTFPVGDTLNNLSAPGQRAFSCDPRKNVSGAIARNSYTFTKVEGATVPSSFALYGWANANYTCGLKTYGTKMYSTSNQLIFDALPCYRKADGVIGIYDTVEEKFFPVSGTWTKGAEV